MAKPATSSPLSRIELIRLTERGVSFLHTTSTRPAVLAEMARLGYTPEAHAEGWKLQLAMLGHNAYPLLPGAQPSANLALDPALAGLNSFRTSDLRRAQAALDRRFPNQAKYLFGKLKAQTRAPASAVIAAFLDCYARLRDGNLPARASIREQDRGAVALLQERKVLNPTIEKQLRDWIAVAQTPVAEQPAPNDSRRIQALAEAAIAFKAWFDDWRISATTGIQRRDDLIALGLASRRPKGISRKAAAVDGE